MGDPKSDLEWAVAKWQESGWPNPEVILVSGSGLAVDMGTKDGHEAPLSEWLPFPTHQIEGHPLLTQILEPRPGLPVLYQQGRLHSYQGYDAHQIVFMIRLAALLQSGTNRFINFSVSEKRRIGIR